MATAKRELGKDFRLHIGATATPTNDTSFLKVVNENNLSIKKSADVQEDSTKEDGTRNNPGDETYEITFDFNQNFEDTGMAVFDEAFNKPWAYQIRYLGEVWLEGDFILSELEYNAESKNTISGSGTLVKAGSVTMSNPPRALIPTP